MLRVDNNGFAVEISGLNFNYNSFYMSCEDYVLNKGEEAPKYGNKPNIKCIVDPASYVPEYKHYKKETEDGLLEEKVASGYILVKVENKKWSDLNLACLEKEKFLSDDIIGDLYERVFVVESEEYTLNGTPISKEEYFERELCHRKGSKFNLSEWEFTMNYHDED